MELALTFGSLGDIIQLCQIGIQLSRAIGLGCDAVGQSAVEYEELRREINTFVRILMQVILNSNSKASNVCLLTTQFQVIATYEQHEASPYLHDLNVASRDVVEQCSHHMMDVYKHFTERYGNTLDPGGSGNKFRDICKKVQWSTSEGERIACLKDRLRDGITRLNLLGNLVTQ